MASAGVCLVTAGLSQNEKQRQAASIVSENGRFQKNDRVETTAGPLDESELSELERASLKDYFEQAKDLIRSDGGPPRLDGVGLGLILQHQRLGRIFDIWCLHIPVKDRTSFTDLVKLVERTVRSENYRSPNRPIYLVGESLGGCLALAVAARNPDIDLVLILANPATSFSKSPLQPLIPLLQVMPDQLYLSQPFTLSLMAGDPLRMAIASIEKGLPLQQLVGELSQGLVALSSYLPVLVDILPKETLLWKLHMLKSASASANSRLHAVKAQMLILFSGRDQLLPNQEEGERLHQAMPTCSIRKFKDNGGMREACHRKVVFDYDDQMKIPYFRDLIEKLTEEAVRLRSDVNEEVGNQDMHLPGILPKVPGRFYYFFGKPIETEGRKRELRDREKAHELYLHVKSEVEACIAYLKEKREKDPYRNILPRLLHQATQGSTSEIPTFEL
ncbi:hypothetical protein L1049_002489 [Liquidambar formosana]|uniref:Serine aminopeptidase S33 domain-containing protein n=1 Tax=Liquidambar formosana TaxID=63359 RepID=A0AAP0NK12_LIQFO